MADATVKLDGEDFTRDEVAMCYTALFYITNGQTALPAGHPPTPAQTAQLKLAKVLDEDLPEAAMQDIQRQLDQAQELAARRQQMRADVERRAAEAARATREAAEAEIQAQAREATYAPQAADPPDEPDAPAEEG